MRLKVVRALYEANAAHEERQHKMFIASMRVAQHADDKAYTKFLHSVFGSDD